VQESLQTALSLVTDLRFLRPRLLWHSACCCLLTLLDRDLTNRRAVVARSGRLGWRVGSPCVHRATWSLHRCRGVNRSCWGGWWVNIDIARHGDFAWEEPALLPINHGCLCVLVQILIHWSQGNLTNLSLVESRDTLRVQEHLNHALKLRNVVLQSLNFEIYSWVLFVCLPNHRLEFSDHLLRVFNLILEVGDVWSRLLCLEFVLKL